MKLDGSVAIVTGGAGGLGEAATRQLTAEGCRVVIADYDPDKGKKLQEALGEDKAVFRQTDVTDTPQVLAAIDSALALGPLRVVAICHGAGGGGTRTVQADGSPHDYDAYRRTIEVYLNGTFNVLRLTAAAMGKLDPLEEGERGVIVLTASIAGYEGTIGQVAYAAAKGGVIGMTLVAARDLAVLGIRVAAIAPGTFVTPGYRQTPEELEAMWGPHVPFPKRMGRPAEYASMLAEICRNSYVNGEVIRIDGAIRFQPRYPR
jgi:NAD(P)-dependent dehydrogenase (short-subunit alcohol dehydrogenase family)